jgi:hypothetical protein
MLPNADTLIGYRPAVHPDYLAFGFDDLLKKYCS